MEIEQFVGAWCRLDEDAQCRLDEGAGRVQQLGVGAWSATRFGSRRPGSDRDRPAAIARNIWIFCRAGPPIAPLRAITGYFPATNSTSKLQLILKREETPGVRARRRRRSRSQAWIFELGQTRPLDRDPAETILQLS